MNPVNHEVIDTGLTGACGACGAYLLGDPILGAAVGAIVAAAFKWATVAIRQAIAAELERRSRPPEGR